MIKPLMVFINSAAGLLALGILALYSATARHEHPERFYSHLIWLCIGMTACLLFSSWNYTGLQKRGLPKLVLGAAILLLFLVLIPGVSEDINGSHRWFRFGGQPSEFAKLALIVALADYAARQGPMMQQCRRGFLVPVSWAGAIAGLIFLEPDWGTAILTGTVAMIMIIVAGARWRYVIAAEAVAVALLFLVIQYHPERLGRLPIFVEGLAGDHRNVWQVWHSVLSFAAGGFWGTSPGLGNHKYGFVAEQETDFILSLIGEELGFAGSTLVVVFFLGLLISGIMIAWRANDTFGQLLVIGIIFSIGLQAFINIGVVTSSLPNKGLPLPFVSYGGSNMVCLLTGVGWVVSVASFAPRSQTISEPILNLVADGDKTPTTVAAPPINPAAQPGWFRRRLLRICLGPTWPCQINVRYPYQLPPKNRIPPPQNRLQQWISKRCHVASNLSSPRSTSN
jgi:cell division protein FtsW